MITLETKTQILHDLYMHYNNEYPDFVEVHDIGVPLSALIIIGSAVATAEGVKDIEATYDNWCEFLEIDKYGDYATIEEMIDLAEG